jgi:hypothetical protein
VSTDTDDDLPDADHGAATTSPQRRRRQSRSWLSSPPSWASWPGAWLSAPTRRLGALVYAVTQVVLLLWWIAFFPGLMSYDSVMYLWQATTDNWSTSHSVAYNALLWLSLQLGGEVALLTLAQTVAMASGLAYAVVGLRLLRVPGRWVALAAGLAVCLPAVGTFTVYVSKDTAFVICQVWLLGTVARLVATRLAASPAGPPAAVLARPPKPPGRLLWTVFAELALMALFRQNGFVVIALTTIGLVAALAGIRWRLIACGVGAIAVGFVANLALYPALGVRSAGSELLLGPAYADLALAYQQRPNAFTAADEELLARVAPLDFWRNSANCYDADQTVSFGRPQFSIAAARENQAALFDLWLTIGKRAPDVIVGSRLCRGAIAWNPFPGPAHGWTRKVPIAGVTDYFGFPAPKLAQSPYRGAVHLAPLNETIHQAGVFVRRLGDPRLLEWIAWRGATWAYVAYFAVILFAHRRGSWTLLALVAVIAANQVSVAINNPSQLARYMIGPLILGVLLLPLAFVSRSRVASFRRD